MTRRLIIVAVVAILVLSAGVRFYRLGTPKSYIFDEVYYAKDAKTILKGRVGPIDRTFPWEPGKEVSWPHPEWGKFLIAGGILLFGDSDKNAFGWRFASALAGFAMIAAVYPLARRLGLPPLWALLALALAAADTLGIAQSRIATLDVFVGLWTVLCVLFALRYAQDGRQMRWLVLSGLAGGLALGTKWSGGMALLAAGVVLLLLREHNAGAVHVSVWTRLVRAGRAALAPLALLVALPIAIYVASYWQYFAAGHGWEHWRELQRQMWQFNLHLHASHSYASPPASWIIDYRPVWYSYVRKADVVHGVVSIGNAFLWWTAVACLVVLPLVALLQRRRGLVIAPLLVAILYFPWLFITRTSFMYYMTPVAPFLAVLVATAFAAANGVDVRLPRHPPWASAEAEPVGDGPPRAPEEVPPFGEPVEPARRTRRTPVWERPVALILCAAGLAVMTFLWYRIGQAGKAVIWSLPQTVSKAFAWEVIVAAAVLTAAAAIGVSLLTPLPYYGPTGEPEPRRARRALIWELGEALALFAAGIVVMTLLGYRRGVWHRTGHAVKTIFWSQPQAVSPDLAWGVIVTAAVLAAAAVIGIFVLPPLRDLRRQLLWAWSGAIVGWCLVFLPIVLSLPISATHFYDRLMWFRSWI